MTIDPSSGVTSPVELSSFLEAPSSLAFPQSGYGGAEILIAQLGLGSNSTASLVGVDDVGDVSMLISDLGVENPADIRLAPPNFGSFENDAFVVDVGQFSDVTMLSDSGSILVIDDLTQSVSTFVSGLKNPIAIAFANGRVLDDPSNTYVYVLEQGDLDPTSGIPRGNGTLAAYDALGNRTGLVTNILEAGSLQQTDDGSMLFFTDNQSVYLLNPGVSAVWDGDLSVGNDGDGVFWDDANNWTTDGAVDAAPSDNSPGNNVVFAAGPTGATVELAEDRVVNSIRFEDDYTLNGNKLTVTSGTLGVSTGVTATINSHLHVPSFDPETFDSIKIGDGTLVANGNLVGDIVVVEGTLLANNLVDGRIVVENGTLGGTGFAAGAVAVENGGTLAPGEVIGHLTVESAVFNSGSQFVVELGGSGGIPGVDFDQLFSDNMVTLGGDLVIDLVGGFTPDPLDTFAVLSATTLTGTFDNVADNGRLDARGGLGSFLITYDSITNEVVLSEFLANVLGDVNLDGVVNGLDVDPFTEVLLGGAYQTEADMNQDGLVNGLDVDPFVAAVVRAGEQQIPEPSTLLLGFIALGVVGGWHLRISSLMTHSLGAGQHLQELSSPSLRRLPALARGRGR